jgi:hypothetical protein
MAFLAPVAAAAGRGLLARAGASILGRTAGSAVAEGAAGGAAESGGASAFSRVAKSLPMPMPQLGSNGGSNQSGGGTPNTVLNADQFR